MLQQCKEEFIDNICGGKPLEVEMAGIEYMNDDPGMVDVLYAKVHMKDGSNRYVSGILLCSIRRCIKASVELVFIPFL